MKLIAAPKPGPQPLLSEPRASSFGPSSLATEDLDKAPPPKTAENRLGLAAMKKTPRNIAFMYTFTVRRVLYSPNSISSVLLKCKPTENQVCNLSAAAVADKNKKAVLSQR